MGHNATGVGSTRTNESINQATSQAKLHRLIQKEQGDTSDKRIASCDQEAWVLTAIREVARLSYPSGIKGRIDFERDEAAINQAAVEVLETLGYAPCYENIKRLLIKPDTK